MGKIPRRRKCQLTPVFLPKKISWTEEPGRLQSKWLQRVRHNWVTEHSTVHLSTFQSQLWLVGKVFSVAQMVKNLPAMQETWVWPLGQEVPLEKGMAIHSNILAWRIPWTEEPGGFLSMGSQRVGHNWATNNTITTMACGQVASTSIISCISNTPSLYGFHGFLFAAINNKSSQHETIVWPQTCSLEPEFWDYTVTVHLGLNNAVNAWTWINAKVKFQESQFSEMFFRQLVYTLEKSFQPYNNLPMSHCTGLGIPFSNIS